MRLHRAVPVLATALVVAGGFAPAASASEAMAPSGGGQPATLVQHDSGNSIDPVIGIGAATGIAILGTGAAVSLRNRRRTAARHPRPVSE